MQMAAIRENERGIASRKFFAQCFKLSRRANQHSGLYFETSSVGYPTPPLLWEKWGFFLPGKLHPTEPLPYPAKSGCSHPAEASPTPLAYSTTATCRN